MLIQAVAFCGWKGLLLAEKAQPGFPGPSDSKIIVDGSHAGLQGMEPTHQEAAASMRVGAVPAKSAKSWLRWLGR